MTAANGQDPVDSRAELRPAWLAEAEAVRRDGPDDSSEERHYVDPREPTEPDVATIVPASPPIRSGLAETPTYAGWVAAEIAYRLGGHHFAGGLAITSPAVHTPAWSAITVVLAGEPDVVTVTIAPDGPGAPITIGPVHIPADIDRGVMWPGYPIEIERRGETKDVAHWVADQVSAWLDPPCPEPDPAEHYHWLFVAVARRDPDLARDLEHWLVREGISIENIDEYLDGGESR